MAGEDILIIGAGISGMVASYNLAVDGHRVLVREREPVIGGPDMLNPSIHTTPLDLEATSEYIGIDISTAFKPIGSLSLYIHDFRIDAPVTGAYHVERSSRPQSLDTLLYEKCVDAGVEFEFGSPLKGGEVSSLPPGTIIACGLSPEAYESAGVPFSRWYAWMARGESEHENYAWVWLDECITEYGYLSFCNGIYYNMLPTYERELDDGDLERYRDFMKRVEGIEETEWEYISGAVPLAHADNPRLFRDGLIMCGTMSGCFDPFMGFGISGALVSGKVAATAVTDRKKAQEEFERFTRNFSSVYTFKQELWYRLRERVDLLEDIARILGPERSLQLLVSGLRYARKKSAIPGFNVFGCN